LIFYLICSDRPLLALAPMLDPSGRTNGRQKKEAVVVAVTTDRLDFGTWERIF
jgi:hypothetical protein